jgi:phospholipid/cholesterol/gamma-HCH transport system substrate-binding protein
MQNILERVNVLLGQVEDPETPLGDFVRGEDFYSKLRDYVTGFQTTIHKYDNPQSELGKSIYGQALYQEMRQRVLDIDRQIEQVQQNPWLAKTTNYDAWLDQAKRFRQTVVSFREAPMMKQDDFYNNTRDALARLDDTVRAMSAGRLLTGTETYESLNGSSRNMRNFLKDFRENPQKYLRLKVF